jgi:hypothetical protein
MWNLGIRNQLWRFHFTDCGLPVVDIIIHAIHCAESGKWKVESGVWKVESGGWSVEVQISFLVSPTTVKEARP